MKTEILIEHKLRSDFVVVVDDETGDVHVTDLNIGGMSVTNDAESVIDVLHAKLDLTGRTVTYTDTEGQVDRLMHTNGIFTGFAPGTGR